MSSLISLWGTLCVFFKKKKKKNRSLTFLLRAVHGPLLVTGISLVKISLGFFLLRFVQGLWYTRFIIFMIGTYSAVHIRLFPNLVLPARNEMNHETLKKRADNF